MSSWHTPDDPREFTDPPIEAACDLCGVGRVYVAAEDWEDNQDYYCVACVLRIVNDRDAAADWPEMVPV